MFDDFATFYVAKMRRKNGRNPSPVTVKGKVSSLRGCATATGATTCASLCTLMQTREQLNQLYDTLSVTQSPGALRKVIYAIKDLGDFARANGWPVPPVETGDLPGQNPQKPIVVYTDEERTILLSHARAIHGARWELFLETIAGTGRRVGEVLGLEWAWLNLSADTPHFHLPNTKNGRQAYVPLNLELARAWGRIDVSELRKGQGRGFARDAAVYPFPWTYSCVHEMFVRYCNRVGVVSRGFHCFRHTRATEMLARGVPIQAVAALLGHANVATTDRLYNHTNALSYAEYV